MTNEERLKEMAAVNLWGEDSQAACLAGAEALRIAREGVPRYLQNGGCSNCGAVPHASTCMIGQLAALLATDHA